MAGRAGRFVCIFVPLLLTLASLIFLILLGLGGTNSRNTYLSNVYFLQVNTTAVTSNPDFIGNPLNSAIDPIDVTADNKIYIENFYTVSLWSYCGGNGDNVTRSALAFGQKTAQSYDFCTARQLRFAFPWRLVWGLSDDAQNRVFSPAFQNVIDAYTSTRGPWISNLYILTMTALGVELLVSIGGLFSRLGSLFTTIAALVTFGFSFSFAVLTTLTYFGMAAAGNESFTQTNIVVKAGPTAFVYMWLATACALIGTIFWAFSSCCCSGRSRQPAAKALVDPAPYTYERMSESSLPTTQTVHAKGHAPSNSALEGYRHGQ